MTNHDGSRGQGSSSSSKERQHYKEEKKKEMFSLVQRLRLAEEVNDTIRRRGRRGRVGCEEVEVEDTSNTFLLNDSNSMLALHDTNVSRPERSHFGSDDDEEEGFVNSYSNSEDDEDDTNAARRSRKRRSKSSRRVYNESLCCWILYNKHYQAIAWLTILALGYLFATLGIMDVLETNKEEAIMERHADHRVDDPNNTSAASTTTASSILLVGGGQNSSSNIDDDVFPAAPPTRRRVVTVGLSIDYIHDLSIVKSEWTASFYVWFRWNATTTTKPSTTIQVNDNDNNNETIHVNANDNNETNRQLPESLTLDGIHVNDNNNNNNNRLLDSLEVDNNNQGQQGLQGNGGDVVSPTGVDKDHHNWGSSLHHGKQDPGETFQILGAEVLEKEWMEHKQQEVFKTKTSTTILYYDLYRVKARVNKFFELTRFPLDNHVLTVVVEDRIHDYHELIYVIDEEESEISSQVQIPGYEIETPGLQTAIKWHAYKNARGDPFASKNRTDTEQQIYHSQVVIGIPIGRPDWGLYWMMFQGVFASVAVSFLGLIIQNESQYLLSIGAFFACVVSTIVTTTQVPMMGVFSLAAYINGISLATILLTMVHVFLSKHIFKESRKRWFDIFGLAVFVMGYIGCTVGISQAAFL